MKRELKNCRWVVGLITLCLVACSFQQKATWNEGRGSDLRIKILDHERHWRDDGSRYFDVFTGKEAERIIRVFDEVYNDKECYLWERPGLEEIDVGWRDNELMIPVLPERGKWGDWFYREAYSLSVQTKVTAAGPEMEIMYALGWGNSRRWPGKKVIIIEGKNPKRPAKEMLPGSAPVKKLKALGAPNLRLERVPDTGRMPY